MAITYSANYKIIANPVVPNMGLTIPIACMVAFQILRDDGSGPVVVREYVEPSIVNCTPDTIKTIVKQNIGPLEAMDALGLKMPAVIENPLTSEQQSLKAFVDAKGKSAFDLIDWMAVDLTVPDPPPPTDIQKAQQASQEAISLRRQHVDLITLGILDADDPEVVDALKAAKDTQAALKALLKGP